MIELEEECTNLNELFEESLLLDDKNIGEEKIIILVNDIKKIIFELNNF